MTPKEQAKELVNKFYVILMKKNYPNVAQMDAAKECALIAVDEILETLKIDVSKDSTISDVVHFAKDRIMYCEQVKQEIEKL